MISLNIKQLVLQYKHSDEDAEVIITDINDNDICLGDSVGYQLENSWVYRSGKLVSIDNCLKIECFDQIFNIQYYVNIIDDRYKRCPNCGNKTKYNICNHCFEIIKE